ncbi:hypothetical protein F2P81_001713 [Scophthalmus maximus]|uniref:Uncharacterized protein n=1 Tax=Scophthalmus maximus TaxID=52904 RepID=A0A6A4TPP2_SCOMX|nr:hypothetical protein F2P81_001713 [Scophthalmus maximus]
MNENIKATNTQLEWDIMCLAKPEAKETDFYEGKHLHGDGNTDYKDKGLNNRHHNIHAIWVESRTESNGLDGDTCCDDWSRLTLIKMDPSSQQPQPPINHSSESMNRFPRSLYLRPSLEAPYHMLTLSATTYKVLGVHGSEKGGEMAKRQNDKRRKGRVGDQGMAEQRGEQLIWCSDAQCSSSPYVPVP